MTFPNDEPILTEAEKEIDSSDLASKRHAFLTVLEARKNTLSQVHTSLASDTTERAPEQNNVPEKVSGIEKLAANGFAVPKYRLYLSAEVLRAEGLHGRIQNFKKNFPIGVSTIVRSAHSKESEFSGGAFSSLVLNARLPFEGALAQMIDEARPENSLQIRRDIRHNHIEGYDPNDMGVYLNNLVPSKLQITVVPLDDGTMSLRYFGDGYMNDKDLQVFDVTEGNIDPKKLYTLMHYLKESGYGSAAEPKFDINAFVSEIYRAQALFEQPQEMEIHIASSGNFTFVQTKNTVLESTKHENVDADLFEKGIKDYIHESEMDMAMGRQGTPEDYVVERANQTDVVRTTKALIIDEREWVADLLDRWSKWTNFGKSDLLRNEAMQTRLMEKYAELMRLAEEYPSYALIIKSMQFDFSPSILQTNINPTFASFSAMREQLSNSASVQLRGSTDHYSGVSAASHHFKFGAFGPQQIGIMHHGGQLHLPFKNGDDLTVMVKEGKVSLYSPTADSVQYGESPDGDDDNWSFDW